MRLEEFAGTRMGGTLQIAEAALNELLALMAPGSRGVTVTIMPGNIVLVRYGVFHSRAQVSSTVVTGVSPRLTIRLSSLMVAWGLKAVIQQPFIEVHGRDVTIALARIPALSPWRDLWRHVTRVTFATAAGEMRVGFDVALGDDNAAFGRHSATPSEEQ